MLAVCREPPAFRLQPTKPFLSRGKVGQKLPQAEVANQYFNAALADGKGDDDFCAVVSAVREQKTASGN